jgi:hypothetical protein
MDSKESILTACFCSLAGRYYNPIPTRFLAPIDCLKIPALIFLETFYGACIAQLVYIFQTSDESALNYSDFFLKTILNNVVCLINHHKVCNVHVDNLSRQFTTMSVNSQTSYLLNTESACNTYIGLVYVNRVHRGVEMKYRECMMVSALSAGAYTATLYVMVNIMIGGGRALHTPPFIMMECTPERGHCHYLCTLCS